MAIGAILYTALQVVMIGALDPRNIVSGWAKPLGTDPSDYGAWYTIALAIGAGWLAKVLLIDAVISPAGTGVVYVAATARLSYALGEEREMPSAFASTNSNGVPVVSILFGSLIGCLAFGPFKSWSALVNVVTGATAIMYSYAPVSLAALKRRDPNRTRTYQVPAPGFVLPAAFCSANLILYWGGFDTTWKLVIAMVLGFTLFVVGAAKAGTTSEGRLGNSIWIWAWLAGQVVIGWLGRYGGGISILPNWIDILVVITFSLAIFYWAVSASLSKEATAAAVAKDARQINYV
jgi:amino acid transporter